MIKPDWHLMKSIPAATERNKPFHYSLHCQSKTNIFALVRWQQENSMIFYSFWPLVLTFFFLVIDERDQNHLHLFHRCYLFVSLRSVQKCVVWWETNKNGIDVRFQSDFHLLLCDINHCTHIWICFSSSIFCLESKNRMNLNIKRNRFELNIDMKVSNLLAQPVGGSERRWKYSYLSK